MNKLCVLAYLLLYLFFNITRMNSDNEFSRVCLEICVFMVSTVN